MSRLVERRDELEPERKKNAIRAISSLGYEVKERDARTLEFVYKKNVILFYPYTGWHSGKGIKDGRGLKNLIRKIAAPKRPINSDGVCYSNSICSVDAKCEECLVLDKNGTL